MTGAWCAGAATAGSQLLRQHRERCRTGASATSSSREHTTPRGEQATSPTVASKRTVSLALGAALAAQALGAACPGASSASNSTADKAWEALGGGPSDLVFPPEFLGLWQVRSTLMSVNVPLGEEFVTDVKVVNRAKTEDLNKDNYYEVAFTRNSSQQVILDRRYNTAAIVGMYYDGGVARMLKEVQWDKDDPNDLDLRLPGTGSVNTRVTRRSEEEPEPRKIETSEYFRQTYQLPDKPTKVKASQCFTKYKWRNAAEAKGGPEIVATQVVSDYLTAYDGDMLYMRSMNKPVTVYTYKMTFMRKTDGVDTSLLS